MSGDPRQGLAWTVGYLGGLLDAPDEVDGEYWAGVQAAVDILNHVLSIDATSSIGVAAALDTVHHVLDVAVRMAAATREVAS